MSAPVSVWDVNKGNAKFSGFFLEQIDNADCKENRTGEQNTEACTAKTTQSQKNTCD